jgi:hypothetical protein
MFESCEKILQRELDAAVYPEQELASTVSTALATLEIASPSVIQGMVPCVQKIYLLVYAIFQKFSPCISQKQRVVCHGMAIQILSSMLAKKWSLSLSGEQETFVARIMELFLRSFHEEGISGELVREGMMHVVVQLAKLDCTGVPSDTVVEILQHFAAIFPKLSLCGLPFQQFQEYGLFVYSLCDALREKTGYREHQHVLDGVIFSLLDTLLAQAASGEYPGDGVTNILLRILATNLARIQDCALNESSRASLCNIEASIVRLTSRVGRCIETGLLSHLTMALHVLTADQSACAYDSKKISDRDLRSLEELLVTLERRTALSNQTVSLLALELLAIGVLKACEAEGLHFEPCQESSHVTFREEGERSALHTRLEDAMATGQLDVACAAYCSSPSSSEEGHWRLFTVWTYLRKFIALHKIAQRKMYQEFQEQWSGVVRRDARLPRRCGPGQSVPPLPPTHDDLTGLYSSPEFVRYEELCQGCPLPDEAVQKGIIAGVSKLLTRCYLETIEDLARSERQGKGRISSYSREVSLFTSHVAKSVGYLRLGRLPATLSIDGTFVTVCPRDCTDVQWCKQRFVPRLIDGLMKGGEEGLARALCQSFAPGNKRFLAAFLETVHLSVAPSDDYAQSRGDEGEEATCASGQAAPAASAPQPSRPSVHHKNKKIQAKLQVPRPDASVQHECPSVVLSASGETVPAASAPQPLHSSAHRKKKKVKVVTSSPSQPPQCAPSVERVAECASGALSPPSDAGSKQSSPLPTREAVIRNILSSRVLQVDERISEWRKAWFASVQRDNDEVDFHIYPLCFASLIRTIGESGPWVSPTTGKLSDRLVCVGQIHRLGRTDAEGGLERPFLGLFTEGVGKDKKLFHHFFQVRSFNYLLKHYEIFRSFYEVQEKNAIRSDFQEELYRKAKKTGSFFDSLPEVPMNHTLSPRFFIQSIGTTVRVTDWHTMTAYSFASLK